MATMEIKNQIKALPVKRLSVFDKRKCVKKRIKGFPYLCIFFDENFKFYIIRDSNLFVERLEKRKFSKF